MDEFERLVADLDYPMVIVTCRGRGELSGCLVGFSSEVSISPPRYLVGLSDKNHTFKVAKGASHLAVHFPSALDMEIIKLFGGKTGDEINKFDHCIWCPSDEDPPILDIGNWFIGEILERIDFGDHMGYLLKPVRTNYQGFKQVGFQEVKDLEPGHEP